MSGSTFLFLKNVHSLVLTLQEQKTRPSNEEIAQFADNVVHAYKEIFGGERGTDSNSQGSGSSVEGGDGKGSGDGKSRGGDGKAIKGDVDEKTKAGAGK